VIVTIEHIRAARAAHGGYCSNGMRRWCVQHGVDFRRLLQEGYPVEEIEALAPGDAFAQQVLSFVKGEAP
jgi:hypothetical protein